MKFGSTEQVTNVIVKNLDKNSPYNYIGKIIKFEERESAKGEPYYTVQVNDHLFYSWDLKSTDENADYNPGDFVCIFSKWNTNKTRLFIKSIEEQIK